VDARQTIIQQAWPAPAKLNLFLHITGRREDGYHELQTVFQFLDRCDELRFSPRPDTAIHRVTEVHGVTEDQDLVVRAARLLQTHSGVTHGVDIRLTKHLPMGGGLGGGSSDAATTLLVLNQLWQLDWPVSKLTDIALQLGADVPVFIHGTAAWAEGIGEQLTPLELIEPWYVVLVPEVHVSTAELFQDPQLTRHAPPLRIRDFLAGGGQNVFEPLVRHKYPAVDKALADLARYAPAHLTGTGACVFAAFEDKLAAQTALDNLTGRWQGFVARGCNHSPLHAALAKINA